MDGVTVCEDVLVFVYQREVTGPADVLYGASATMTHRINVWN